MPARTTIDEAIAKLDELLLALGGGAKLEAVKAAAAPAPSPSPATVPPLAAPSPTKAVAMPTMPNTEPELAVGVKPAKQPKDTKKTSAPATAQAAPTDLFSKAKLVVGHLLEAGPVENSEKLLKCRIDVGGGEVRQVVAGLQQFVASDALAGSHVVVITNLKPAKLAGQASEAMILAADATVDGTLIVKTLVPPAGSEAGDPVYLEGTSPSEGQPKVLKSVDWKKIVASLSVVGGRPAFEGKPFCTARGLVTLPTSIPDGSSIH